MHATPPVERPVIFSAPMVRAVLSGCKTQTRRPILPQPMRPEVAPHCENGWWMWRVWTPEHAKHGFPSVRTGDRRCPYGEPGDRLWVKERHAFLDVTKSAMSNFPLGPQNVNRRGPVVWNLEVEYSDGRSVEGERPKQTRERGDHKWRPAIHMPRWASRITLEVTSVRVERLLSISVDDSFAEGIEPMRCPECHLAAYGLPGWGHDDLQKTPIEAYWHLWDAINEKRGHGRAKNPWVWVVEFRRA